MSKAHAKQQAQDTQAAQELQAPQTSTAVVFAARTAPVVQPAQGAPAPDARHGHGGLYTMKDGRRVLVEQTQPETTKERK